MHQELGLYYQKHFRPGARSPARFGQPREAAPVLEFLAPPAMPLSALRTLFVKAYPASGYEGI